MRRLLASFSLLLIAPLSWGVPQIQHWQTQNGAKVLFVPSTALPIVDLRVVFAAGSVRDNGLAGVAQLTNNLLDTAAGDLNAQQIATQLEGVGARLGLESLRDMAVLSLRSLREERFFKPAFEVFNTILQQPRFEQSEIDRIRKQMLISLKNAKQSPSALASKAFYKAVYGTHPLASPPGGTDESLPVIQREQILAFYQRFYVAKNAVIAIVADLDRAAAEALAERISSGLPEGKKAAALPMIPELKKAQLIRIQFPSKQSHISIGQAGMSRTDADFYPLYVGNHTFGGSGFSSRLMQEVREKRGLAYSVYSYFSPMEQAGPFEMGLQTRNDQVEESLQIVKRELQKFITEGPSAEELDASIRNITGAAPLRIDSNKKLVQYLAMIGFYHLPLDYLDKFDQRITSVSLAQVKTAFQQRLHPDKMVTVIVGDQTVEAANEQKTARRN
ncbi:MAG: pitrilysin family protein [Gammaproteobacteria bacterium]|nr:pitrilysin family protein [Gammaproteobacteria bacterium]